MVFFLKFFVILLADFGNELFRFAVPPDKIKTISKITRKKNSISIYGLFPKIRILGLNFFL